MIKAGGALLEEVGSGYLMDLIPLDASLVKGSHGRPARRARRAPGLYHPVERSRSPG